jgi:hypothetical protein
MDGVTSDEDVAGWRWQQWWAMWFKELPSRDHGFYFRPTHGHGTMVMGSRHTVYIRTIRSYAVTARSAAIADHRVHSRRWTGFRGRLDMSNLLLTACPLHAWFYSYWFTADLEPSTLHGRGFVPFLFFFFWASTLQVQVVVYKLTPYLTPSPHTRTP